MKRTVGVLVTGVLAVTVGIAAQSPVAATGRGPVGTVPASFPPSLATSGTDGSVEQVRQLARCGSTMYAVGRFSRISQGGHTFVRHNAFSFSASSGHLTRWNPRPNGQVDGIALTADCSRAFLAGRFTTAGGLRRPYLSAVRTTSGAAIAGFRPAPNKPVTAVVRVGRHLLVGGYFTALRGATRHRYFASVATSTGRDDGYAKLRLTGTYSYTDDAGRHSARNVTKVHNFALAPGGHKLLVMGVFTRVAGHSRRQIFMADLGSSLTLDGWRSPEFGINCAVGSPFWLRDASWSPDGRTVYTATTGYKPANGPAFSTTAPREGLCDSAAAFPVTHGAVRHRWINYTGCDSLYSTAADDSAVYFGGHERWADNASQCDNNDSLSAVSAPGMVGLDVRTGQVAVNPTRDRGVGADDMLVTSAGLWIASDNAYGANSCGRTPDGRPSTGHAGICFLPY